MTKLLRNILRRTDFTGINGRLLVVVLIVVLPMLILLAVTAIGQVSSARRDTEVSAQRNAALAGQGATALFASATDLLLTVSSFPSVQASDVGRCAYILGQMMARLEAYGSATIAGPDGAVICTSEAQLRGTNVGTATWFIRALHHDGAVIGDMTPDAQSGERVIHVAQAIRSRFNNVLRVVAISVRVSILERFVRGIHVPDGGSVLFIDSAGELLAHSGPDAETRSADFLRNLREEALGGVRIPAIVTAAPRDADQRVYAVQPITALLGAPVLAIGTPATVAAERAMRAALLQIGILLLSAALACAVAIKIGQQLIRQPIHRLEQAARRVGSGDLDVRLGPPYGADEIGALTAHFDTMVASLRGYQDELHSVHQRLEQLMTKLPVGVFRLGWQPRFSIELANDAMAPLLARPMGEVMALDEHWALSGSGRIERAGVRAAIETAVASGQDYDVRYQMVTADGRLRWFIEKGGPRYQDGAVYLEGLLADITAEKRGEESLRDEYERLVERSGQAIASIASIIETRDPYTAGHSRRVTNIAVQIAGEMGLSRERIDGLRLAGLVHDIGKISVPIEFLTRPVKLSDAELNVIKQHAASGYDILKGMDWPWPVAQIVRQHHERLDGKGYPDGLRGDEILLEAQILAVADTAEAMTWDRPYRKALPISELERVLTREPTGYNRTATAICLRLLRDTTFTHALYAADGSLPPAA
ncbi:MAG TPA: HD domain-containing protein [Alphaproteobacteria bacterium]|nr:HD domain-containing protein [Alphaproteobacteria bacterium]